MSGSDSFGKWTPRSTEKVNVIVFSDSVDERDIDDLRVEDLLDFVADQVVHGLAIEPLGEPGLNAVDDRELGGAAARLVPQSGVLEGHREARGNRRQSA